jgi:hypothetical protein
LKFVLVIALALVLGLLVRVAEEQDVVLRESG